MSIEYIKKAAKTSATGEDNTRDIVVKMLSEIETGGEEKALDYAKILDGWDQGNPIVSREQNEAAKAKVPQQAKDDIQFAYDRVSAFVKHQRDSMQEFEVELSPGLFAGQKLIPMTTAGCYVPGGRYAHIASAIMSVATAKVAGVEIAIIADATADPEIVACDLVGQAEHGPDSPAWLFTDSRELANAVVDKIPGYIESLPEVQRNAANTAWRDYGEVVLCDTREEVATISDQYAGEHLEVQAEDLDWWLARLKNYGSLFVGEEATVAFGDKCSGTNHILPTKGTGRYTGGLSAAKFIKVVTYQRQSQEATRDVADNFIFLIIDNGSYGSTGDQPTYAGKKTSLAAVASACGCENVIESQAEDAASTVQAALDSDKMTIIVCKCESGNIKVPVIQMDPVVIRDRFMKELESRNA